jgi:hypothetical protein
MEQLQHVLLVGLGIAALITLAALGSGLYEFRTGRLLRFPFRRWVPATPEDVRKNGLALVLNDLGTLLVDVIVLTGLLVHDVRFDSFVAIGYLAVGAAGFTASLLSMLTALHLRAEVHYQERGRPRPAPSAQP